MVETKSGGRVHCSEWAGVTKGAGCTRRDVGSVWADLTGCSGPRDTTRSPDFVVIINNN